jgi:very-short-patch-repair endonuclease
MKIKGKSITPAQRLLQMHLHELGVDTIFEYQFVKERKFAADLADLDNSILFECDGGQFSGGHMRGKKLEEQYEKDRLAQLYGFRMMRFTNRQILNGEAKKWLQEHLYPF